VLAKVDSAGGLTVSPAASLGYTLVDISLPSGQAYPGVLVRSGSSWITALNPTGFDSYWQARFQPTNASTIPLYIRGAASQTADLQQWQNSAGTVLAYVDKDGNVFAPTATTGTNTTQVATTAFVQTAVAASAIAASFLLGGM
jgi:hypothetical protein